jgi:glycosyltransferase involved in cell wall biosynthesis
MIYISLSSANYTLFIEKIDTFSSRKETFIQENMTCHNIGITKTIWKLWQKGFLLPFLVTMPYLLLKIIIKMSQIKPNVIVIHQTSVYTGLLGFLCSKILRKKLLVEYNDLLALYTYDTVEKKIPKNLRELVKALLMTQEDIIVKYGWRVTAITQFIKDYAAKRKTQFNIEVIPDGVDTIHFDPVHFNKSEIRTKFAFHEQDILCLYAGRIDYGHGTGILLETAKLLEATPNFKFLIAGEGNLELVNRVKVAKNMTYAGLIAREDIPKYLAAADIVLIPFPKRVASHSISPLKLFEALSMGKPVVASNISGIEEVVHNDFSGVLVSDNPNHWASAILKIGEDTCSLGICKNE